MPTTTITAEERAERERIVAASIHSGEMEGLSISDEARADNDEYIAGVIDADEVVARARARHGLA